MHAYLLKIHVHASLYHVLPLLIGHGCMLYCCLYKDQIFHHAYVIHSAVFYSYALLFPNGIQIAGR
jgi:hypothetical protein